MSPRDPRDRVAADFRALFEVHEAGARVMAELAGICKWDAVAWSESPFGMAYNAGARDVFLQIMRILDYQPERIARIRRDYRQYREVEVGGVARSL